MAGRLELAGRFDIPLVEIHTHELDDPNYLANPSNRCFFCKTELWSRLVPLARERGLTVVCDGTNADDLHEHRPGKAAGAAAGVRSPLAEVGMTKAEIRAASRELRPADVGRPRGALSFESRPVWALDYAGTVAQVEDGEAYLRSLGIRGDLRLRHAGDVARIEVEASLDSSARSETRRNQHASRDLGFAQSNRPRVATAGGAC